MENILTAAVWLKKNIENKIQSDYNLGVALVKNGDEVYTSTGIVKESGQKNINVIQELNFKIGQYIENDTVVYLVSNNKEYMDEKVQNYGLTNMSTVQEYIGNLLTISQPPEILAACAAIETYNNLIMEEQFIDLI